MILDTPLVKPGNPPRTLEENEETLLTTEAAKAEPGMDGIEMLLPAPPKAGGVLIDAAEGMEAGLATDGSYRHHQAGVGIRIGPLKVSLVRSSYFLSNIVQSITSS